MTSDEKRRESIRLATLKGLDRAAVNAVVGPLVVKRAQAKRRRLLSRSMGKSSNR